MRPEARCLLLVMACAGCGEKPSESSTSARIASASASAGGSAAKANAVLSAAAVCDVKGPDEHTCFEMLDGELAAEREATCGGAFARHSSCAREGVLGICRLPEGTLRFGYPPKTLAQHEKACIESQGRFLAGDKPPAEDLVTLVSCNGKYESACEEEEVHTGSRLDPAAEECRTFGGKFSAGAGCPRDDAVAVCDLKGKRTIVLTGPSNADARKRFCDERSGKLSELAPAAASASASVAPATDDDPPAPKPDAVIRVQ